MSLPTTIFTFSIPTPSPSPPSLLTNSHRPLPCLRTSPLTPSATLTAWLPLSGTRGAGLLERPSLDQTQFDPLPQPEEGGNMGKLRDKVRLRNGDSYRVLLIDDARHTEKLVEKALPKVVPSVTVGEATTLFHESREKGVAVVIVTVKEHAEFYAEMMIKCGLHAAIEPNE